MLGDGDGTGKNTAIVKSSMGDLFKSFLFLKWKDMVGHDKDGKNIVIFSLAVLPEFQGNGISKKLMEGFIEHIQQTLVSYIFSILQAAPLYSGCFDKGSIASIVSKFINLSLS
jgi:GNAT superfamily N-acetyltransferase